MKNAPTTEPKKYKILYKQLQDSLNTSFMILLKEFDLKQDVLKAQYNAPVSAVCSNYISTTLALIT